MELIKLKSSKNSFVEGPLLIKPNIFRDERGYFFESWNQSDFDKVIGNPTRFVQDNESFSTKGVLRGLHYQLRPFDQGKLVRCTYGSIYDVIVDLREKSPTFLHWIGSEINEGNQYLLWIPKGFAHGFLTLSENAKVLYKTTKYWEKDYEKCLFWNDKKVQINWPLDKINTPKPFLSDKDSKAISFEEAQKNDFLFK